MYYVVDNRDWSISWDGTYITQGIRESYGTPAYVTTTSLGIRNQIVHYGSRPTFFSMYESGLHRTNKNLFTWFHGDGHDQNQEVLRQIELIPHVSREISAVVTSCAIGRQRMLEWGADESKVRMIPLGIDTQRFVPPTPEAKRNARARLGIPPGAVCIGSFQKDGVGWGDGIEPKLVKGPDVFVAAVEKLAQQHDVFVLLTGPARGWVKRELAERNIPCESQYVRHYWDLPSYYHALDLYLVTSRDEGGPKAVLEALATGTPIVSTRVGMAPDVLSDALEEWLVDVEDVDSIVAAADRIIRNRSHVAGLTETGLEIAASYRWTEIARRYHEQVYAPLLST